LPLSLRMILIVMVRSFDSVSSRAGVVAATRGRASRAPGRGSAALSLQTPGAAGLGEN
jgi:hypothetical protein